MHVHVETCRNSRAHKSGLHAITWRDRGSNTAMHSASAAYTAHAVRCLELSVTHVGLCPSDGPLFRIVSPLRISLQQLRGLVQLSLSGARLDVQAQDSIRWLYDGPDDQEVSLTEYMAVMKVRVSERLSKKGYDACINILKNNSW